MVFLFICRIDSTPCWMPRTGMKFSSVDEAWKFWVSYGGKICFDVRKQYNNKSAADGLFNSSRFVCSSAGHRGKDKRDYLTKNPRAETRTGCNVRMGITLNRVEGNYELYDLVTEHNHILQLPETCHLMPSQRKISHVQAFEIDMADDSGIRPKAAYELASREAGGSSNLGYTRLDHKNYLRTKRQRNLMYGEAGSMLKYFQDKCVENPSFHYAIQLDCNEQITNIFWADAKMIIDYAHFGDVVTFDTTFGTNRDHRPLGVFVGFNHFRETVIFGGALLYDETFESFKWLFETFLAAHNQKHPKTIYTDQDMAMKKAIAAVFPGTWHGLCTFHIMQNAVKHLPHTKSDGPNILGEFSACMFEYEDEITFEKAFSALRSKVHNDSWLASIYKHKEKWAKCYMKNALTLGMRSTQLSESLNDDLKDHLKFDLDIIRFFTHFERAVQGKLDKELGSEYESGKKMPRIKMKTPMLLQVSQLYTPCIFEAFQSEYERSMAAYARATNKTNEYIVGIGALDGKSTVEEECLVVSDPSDQMVSYTCRQFERCRIMCSHALKVLDMMNIKLLPDQYILKRWTREARCGTVQDIHGRNVLENLKIDAKQRYQFLCRKFLALASRAADFEESYLLIDGVLNSLNKQVEDKIKEQTPFTVQSPEEQTPSTVPEKYSHVTSLKKKEVRKRGSKQTPSWVDKFHKKKSTTQKKVHVNKVEKYQTMQWLI